MVRKIVVRSIRDINTTFNFLEFNWKQEFKSFKKAWNKVRYDALDRYEEQYCDFHLNGFSEEVADMKKLDGIQVWKDKDLDWTFIDIYDYEALMKAKEIGLVNYALPPSQSGQSGSKNIRVEMLG